MLHLITRLVPMTKFIHSDLGYRSRGDVLEVTLTSAANVRLLDSSNFNSYRNGRDHHYHGGLATKTPARITVPSSGHWHAVVDMQGLRGSTNAGFRIVKAEALRPLPPLRQAIERPDIATVFENAASMRPDGEEVEYDVFISHASEDKDTIVRALAHELRSKGLSVWYDEFTLRIGDSLRRKIDLGISKSRFGLVVLSRSFFAKGWTQYELDGLVSMAIDGNQVILPIWHEITKDEVMRRSPSLCDRVALLTSQCTVEQIANEVATVVSRSL